MFPAVFINHGGGPLPLLGKSPDLVSQMEECAREWIPNRPKAIVVLSAHWESSPVSITSAERPTMFYDYYGFPPESYEYEYPAPGSPQLAQRIHDLLQEEGIDSMLDDNRGFDHGVFVPLMIMYPEADIPVVCVSLHASLDADANMAIGKAIQSLRNDDILILGSGYTFHNMKAFMNPDDSSSIGISHVFNTWLKNAMLSNDYIEKLRNWEMAPGSRVCHPREEHLLPLLVVAGTSIGNQSHPHMIYDTSSNKQDHAVSGYLFT